MSDRTPTKVMVTILDLSPLESEALKMLDKKRFPEATSMEVGFTPHGFVETPQGLYALCQEGVGNANPITESNKYEVDFYARYENGGYCFPAVTGCLDADELRQYATTEKVNLADFIRKFGARLESNYDQWRQTLEKVM